MASPGLADPPGAWAGRVQVFRDWRLDCRAEPCDAYTAIAGASGSEVLRLAVTAGVAPALAVSTALPLHLPAGLALEIGTEPERVVPWRTCDPRGCEADAPLDSALLAALRRERGGSATFTLVDGVVVRLPFSLLGFSATLAARDGAQAVKP